MTALYLFCAAVGIPLLLWFSFAGDADGGDGGGSDGGGCEGGGKRRAAKRRANVAMESDAEGEGEVYGGEQTFDEDLDLDDVEC